MIETLLPIGFMLLAFFLHGLMRDLWDMGHRISAVLVLVICGYAVWLGQPAPKIIAIPVSMPELREPSDPFHPPQSKLRTGASAPDRLT